jgi:hypothetical protein
VTARKVPKPPGPGATEVMSTGHRPDLAAIDPEPLNEDERRWRAYVTREMAEKSSSRWPTSWPASRRSSGG